MTCRELTRAAARAHVTALLRLYAHADCADCADCREVVAAELARTTGPEARATTPGARRSTMTPTTDRPPRTTEPLLIEELALAIGRHQGNTTAAVSSGATVLCRDAQEAQRLEREYRVKSVPVTRPERLRGMSCSFVLDVSALGVLAADARQCVERAKQLLAERDEKIAELEAAATTAQRRHCPRIGDGYCRNYYRGAPEMWCYLCRLLVPHDEATK